MGKIQTSWEGASKRYHKIVGEKGHYYHRQVVLPNLLKLMQLKKGDSLLDLACGQGVLSRVIPPFISYTGVDLSTSLIDMAKKTQSQNHHFLLGDICSPLSIEKKNFTHAAIILALQNVEFPQKALENATTHLQNGGKLFLVLNHPCFRIPRQSSWEVDSKNNMQYRRVNRYLSSMKIPIQMHPGQKNSPMTTSFHFSLSELTLFLQKTGFMIEKIEEWTSDKKSTGGNSRRENLSRKEFPLFMMIQCVKNKF